MIKIKSSKSFNWIYLKAQYWYPFIIILGVNLFLLLSYSQIPFFGDAQSYMALSRLYVVDGHFSLLNYQSLLRGYFFPLLLQIPVQLSNLTGLNEVLGFRIVSAVASALCLTVLFPKFFEKLFNFRARPIQKLIFAGLITFLWYGHFAYPLSDFPALAFFLLGLILCLKVFKSKKALWYKGVLISLAGVCLASATFIRSSYLIPFLLLMIVLLLQLAFSKFTINSKVILTTLLIISNIFIFTPQLLINKIHFQVNSPYPLNMSGEVDVFSAQFYYGLKIQRNDFGTWVEVQGESTRKPTPSINLPDAQGIAILKKLNIGELDQSWTLGRYLSLVYHQPFDMAALYVRHLFNGLDIVYPTPYVPDIYANQIIYRFINYSLWFLAILMVWKRGIHIKKDINFLIVCFIIILVALPSLAGMVETRYFLPVHVLMYGCVSFWFLSKPQYWKQFFTWRSAISYICFMAACFTFSSYLLSTVGILLQN